MPGGGGGEEEEEFLNIWRNSPTSYTAMFVLINLYDEHSYVLVTCFRDSLFQYCDIP
jgi:hypothetical protein